MTFSVDSDFWLFQSGPRQDALTRTETSEGRGKAFASSLFGVSESPDAPGIDLTRAEDDGLLLASLNMAQVPVSPAGADDMLAPPPIQADAPLPDADPTLKPVPAVMAEVGDPKSSHPTAASPAGDQTVEALSQSARPDIQSAIEAPPLDDTDAPEDTAALVTLPAGPAPAPSAAVSELSAEAPIASSPATLPESRPPASEAVVADDTTRPQAVPVLPETAVVTPAETPLPTPVEIVSSPPNEVADVTSVTQPQAPQIESERSAVAPEVTAPPEAGPRAAPAPAEAMLATPSVTTPATAAAISSPPQIKPAAPEAAAPAADTRRNRPVSAEAEIQAASPASAFVDVIETAAPPAGAPGSAAQPQGAGGDATATPSIAPLSPGAGFLQGQTPGQAVALSSATQLTPTHAVLIASPAQLPDIVARATTDGRDDRITVQLDPPELGRISIDFKFDGQGLQHVTITAESPEAMRQLRQMHFELVQALERNGLSGQNMSFQHQNPQQNEGWGQQAKLAGARPDAPALTGSGLIMAADNTPNRQSAASGRLDIRL